VVPDDIGTIRQIEGAIMGTEMIPASLVKAWMSCDSLAVQGALTHLLAEQSRRIQPSLSWEEVCNIFQNYYTRCLVENVPEGEYVPNKHIAGYELHNWFKYLWHEPSVSREYLLRLKVMLRDLYLENEHLREVIVNAVLEHLFETPEIAEYFSDWKTSPTLEKAYDLAMEWGRDHWPRP